MPNYEVASNGTGSMRQRRCWDGWIIVPDYTEPCNSQSTANTDYLSGISSNAQPVLTFATASGATSPRSPVTSVHTNCCCIASSTDTTVQPTLSTPTGPSASHSATSALAAIVAAVSTNDSRAARTHQHHHHCSTTATLNTATAVEAKSATALCSLLNSITAASLANTHCPPKCVPPSDVYISVTPANGRQCLADGAPWSFPLPDNTKSAGTSEVAKLVNSDATVSENELQYWIEWQACGVLVQHLTRSLSQLQQLAAQLCAVWPEAGRFKGVQSTATHQHPLRESRFVSLDTLPALDTPQADDVSAFLQHMLAAWQCMERVQAGCSLHRAELLSEEQRTSVLRLFHRFFNYSSSAQLTMMSPMNEHASSLSRLLSAATTATTITSPSQRPDSAVVIETLDESIMTELAERKPSLGDFDLCHVLGRGGMGKVLLARDRLTLQYYAIKSMAKQHLLLNDNWQKSRAERNILAVLAEIQHPFLVRLQRSFQDDTHVFLVLDYHRGGDMASELVRRHHFSPQRVHFYACELVLGLAELHRHGIVYRDLKPENVLFDVDGHLVLTDFGLSKQLATDPDLAVTNTYCGTAAYLAPELLREQPYSYAIDWWSLGVLLYEMTFGTTPFWDEDYDLMHDRVLHDPLYFPDPLTEEARSLLCGLLERNPARRLGFGRNGAAQAMSHPYFDGVNWDDVLQKRLPVPYVPEPGAIDDVSQFDEEFTCLSPCLSPTDPYLDDILMRQTATADMHSYFAGFSYNNRDHDEVERCALSRRGSVYGLGHVNRGMGSFELGDETIDAPVACRGTVPSTAATADNAPPAHVTVLARQVNGAISPDVLEARACSAAPLTNRTSTPLHIPTLTPNVLLSRQIQSPRRHRTPSGQWAGSLRSRPTLPPLPASWARQPRPLLAPQLSHLGYSPHDTASISPANYDYYALFESSIVEQTSHSTLLFPLEADTSIEMETPPDILDSEQDKDADPLNALSCSLLSPDVIDSLLLSSLSIANDRLSNIRL